MSSRDLNSLIPANFSLELTSVAAIDDNGNIVGFGYKPDGLQHAFLLRQYFDGFYQPVGHHSNAQQGQGGQNHTHEV
jgi:hypothetical protein